MSDYVGTDDGSQGRSSTAQTAKDEASKLKDTTAGAAKDVAGTAKQEAKSVAGEAKTQAKDLYAQVKREFGDQAGKQQDRLASGLASVGDQFGSMAGNADGGIAADLAQRASDRVGAAASWLKGRDPAGVLEDVKSYARRRPGVFIAGAAVAGIVIGRLTRALAASAADSADAASTAGGDGGGDLTGAPAYAGDATGVAAYAGDSAPVTSLDEAYPSDDDGLLDDVVVIDDTPLYDGSFAARDGGEGRADDRRDTL